MNVVRIAENPEYTLWTFLSALGGSFSLFIGLSFIQLFEVAELVVKLFWSFISNSQLSKAS